MKVRLEKPLSSENIISQQQKCQHVIVPLMNYKNKELAEVFLDGYKDTTDYEGEGISESINEINNIMNGGYGEVITSASGCIEIDNNVASIIFVTKINSNHNNSSLESGVSFIPYVVTRKQFIRQGFAKSLIINALNNLILLNYKICELSVSENNYNAYQLYISLGFQKSLLL